MLNKFFEEKKTEKELQLDALEEELRSLPTPLQIMARERAEEIRKKENAELTRKNTS